MPRPGATSLALVRASHPEPAVAVTTVAALLALAVGHPAGGTVAIAATVLASQLSVGWANDWLDAGRDRAAGRADKPVAAGAVTRRVVGVAALLAVGATVALALVQPPAAAAAAIGGLACAQLYNWPLKLTPVSVLPYVLAFAALPTFVVLALPGGGAPPWWMVATGALLGGGAHFANALPDLDDDARTGVRGLPHRLGPTGSATAGAALLLAGTVVLALGPPGPPTVAGWLAVVGAVLLLSGGGLLSRSAVRRGERPVAFFRAVMGVALLDVALFLLTSGAA